MSLDPHQIRSLRPGPKDYKVADARSLYLLVSKAGSLLWRFDYSFAGKRKTLALGAFPDVDLVDARERRDRAKKLLKEGVDPGAIDRIALAEEQVSHPFESVARRWFAANLAGWSDGYAKRIMARLEGDIFPEIGTMPIHLIEPPRLLAAIRKIEERGAVELAKRVKNYCGDVFRFAIAEGLAERDPSADIKGALAKPKPVKRRAALKAADLPDFFARLERYDGEEQTRLAVELIAHVFVRTSELRFARRAEFEGLDTKTPLWRIPGARMKMGLEHLVPLSPQAVALVRKIFALSTGELLFPSPNTRDGVISDNTMLYALYRMGYHGRATIHGFRGTASTILHENEFDTAWVERQLAHVDQNTVRASYNAAEYMPQRRRMMTWWSDYLDQQAEIGRLLS